MSVRRNTAYNLFGSVVPLAVSLVTIPTYIGLIGEARYGVLAIAWLLLGYFGLFDLGLGRATAQQIAALRENTAEERAQTFWTAFAMNLGLGVIGGLLIWPVATFFFGQIFQIEETLRSEIEAAIPWLILAVPMATAFGVLGGALQGRERFLDLNLISVSGTVLFQLLPLSAAAVWGPNLSLLLPTALLAHVFALLILFRRCRKHVICGQAPIFVPERASAMLRFGGWVTVTAFVGPLMVFLDRFIIGAISGAKAVAYYTVPFQLAERSTIIANALSSALFPRIAAVTSKEQERLTEEGLRSLVVVMTPLIGAGIFLMGPFITWWLGPEFAEQSTQVGQIVLLGSWANSLARIPYAQLQACGRPDLVAKCHLAELLPYLGLLYLGVSTLGLVGAAVAFSLRVLLDFFLLSGLAGALHLSMRTLFVPALLLVTAFLIATQTKPGGTEWLLFVPLHLVISTAWSWLQRPARFRFAAVARAEPLPSSRIEP